MTLKEQLTQGAQEKGDAAGAAPATGGPDRVRPFVRGRLTRLINPFVLGHAGIRRRFKYAVIHHQGRRSGRSYATPVSARPIPGGFVVPMAFGEGADWVRNVQAAGSCVIEWAGVEYPLVDPEVVDLAAIRSAFSPLERALVPVLGPGSFCGFATRQQAMLSAASISVKKSSIHPGPRRHGSATQPLAANL